MMNFTLLPTRLVPLRDLRWGDNGINKDHLSDPHIRREIDDEPIWAELLVSGHLFVHDGRHRCLRALGRGEHEILGHILTHSNAGFLESASLPPYPFKQYDRW